MEYDSAGERKALGECAEVYARRPEESPGAGMARGLKSRKGSPFVLAVSLI